LENYLCNKFKIGETKKKKMKSIIASIFIFIIFITHTVNSQTLFGEDFNYAVRDSLEGLGGWFLSGLNSPYNVKVVSPGLTYTGYVGSGIGNTAFFTNNTNGDIVLHNFTTQTTGTLYMSFLIRVDSMTANATQGYNIAFDQSGGSTNINTQLYVQRVSSTTFKFGISKTGSVTYTANNYNINTTYLAVVKYSFIGGSNNDSAKAYIFSSGVPSTEPAAPDAFSTNGTDMIDNGQVVLSNMYAQGSGLNLSSVKVDGIRIGTTWGGSVLTGITPTSSEVPSGFYLGQNFPNPFNPVTNIYFSIPTSQDVKITVTDMLGKQVAVVVNEKLNAGTYKAEFDASGLSSGVYFYRLEADNFSQVKKMSLVK
jgi:hypothetical protein